MIRTVIVTNVARTAASLIRNVPADGMRTVESIMRDVQTNGDSAVRKYEKKFGVASPRILRVSESEIKSALHKISTEEMVAISMARERLEKTERTVKHILRSRTVSIGGARVTKKFVPIQSVGCYVPGGLARYPSSAVMSVTPAKVAGVKRIVVVSPPGPDGKIDPLTISAASMCGATEIYRVGGAQAIAALTFGTRAISKVDKIVGPGGIFVALAKSIASRNVAIDMLAGPTELGIVADSSADPRHVALDLVSQAEHSGDTRCYLITDSARLAKSVRNQISDMIKNVKRKDIIKKSLRNNGFVAVCKTRGDMAELAELLAPEHLQIITRNPEGISARVTSPGLVLLGRYSPSSASDYLLGSNHILPTGGTGKTRGSLSVLDFVKQSTEVISSKAALAKISRHMQVLADAEGLSNHYEAVRGRLQ